MTKGFFDYRNNFARYYDVKSIPLSDNPIRKAKKFTIAIPTYKRPDLLAIALESALTQSDYQDYEVIVVDNDPNENSSIEIIKNFQKENLYYFKNEANIGLYSNWNRCIELAVGDYISILNDDDWLSSNYLSECNKYLTPGVNGLIFKYNTVFQDTFSERTQTEKTHFPALKQLLSRKVKQLTLYDYFLGNKSPGSLGVIMKRDLLIELGGYNPDYYPSSDYILHANYCKHYNVLLINEILNFYRVAHNASANQDTLRIWEYLDREIRHYLIEQIKKNRRLLHHMNSLLTDLQIQGLIDTWNFKTDTVVNQSFQHTLMKKYIGLKYDLNF